jgi:hypothetical protein
VLFAGLMTQAPARFTEQCGSALIQLTHTIDQVDSSAQHKDCDQRLPADRAKLPITEN